MTVVPDGCARRPRGPAGAATVSRARREESRRDEATPEDADQDGEVRPGRLGQFGRPDRSDCRMLVLPLVARPFGARDVYAGRVIGRAGRVIGRVRGTRLVRAVCRVFGLSG